MYLSDGADKGAVGRVFWGTMRRPVARSSPVGQYDGKNVAFVAVCFVGDCLRVFESVRVCR